MKLLNKYKWYIVPLVVLVAIVFVVIITTPKKESHKVKSDRVTKITHSSSKSSSGSSSSTSSTPTASTELASSQETVEQAPSQPQAEQSEVVTPNQPSDGVGPTQSQLDQAQAQYGYTPGFGGIPADSPEVAREQAQVEANQQARQSWHDDQVEWAKQNGLME